MIPFFGTYVVDFADVSSPSLMGYGQLNYRQFTDSRRACFTFIFFWVRVMASQGQGGLGRFKSGLVGGFSFSWGARVIDFPDVSSFFCFNPVVGSTDESTCWYYYYITQLMSFFRSIRESFDVVRWSGPS